MCVVESKKNKLDGNIQKCHLSKRSKNIFKSRAKRWN